MAFEEVDRPGPGQIGSLLVVHRRGIPVAEGMAGIVEMKTDVSTLAYRPLHFGDFFRRNECIVTAIVEHHWTFQPWDPPKEIVDRRAVVAHGGVWSPTVHTAHGGGGEC